MSSRIDWHPGTAPLGRAVVALGVFDGVHAGHRALLGATVQDAMRSDALSVALTFDRDPDEVVHPEAASPQLLTLDERVGLITATGVDVVLVVPFTPALAATEPETFLDGVLSAVCEPLAVHVGAGFRFGARASGDLDTLYVWGIEHGVTIHPHDLTTVAGAPVSSTRIRALIAAGDVGAAAELLGRPTRVSGIVHHGRGAGTGIGFATANVTPAAHAALPADGVYAGRVHLPDGTVWPAGISVGTPPSFPEARDYLEAHLIGFSGDLYESMVRIDFLSRLRPQQAFKSQSALQAAIAEDLRRVSAIAVPETPADEYFDEDGSPLVEDRAALEAATRAVSDSAALDPDYSTFDETWVPVFGPRRMSLLFSDGGSSAAILTGPLTAAGIPFVWDPFPPDRAQSVRPDFNWQREFRLLVPSAHAAQASALLPRV